jgi:hypothetical protein
LIQLRIVEAGAFDRIEKLLTGERLPMAVQKKLAQGTKLE